MAKTEPSLDQWLAEAKADPKAAPVSYTHLDVYKRQDDDEHDERHHGCGRNAAQQAQNAEQLHQDRQLLPVDGRLVTLQNRCFVVRLGRFGTLVAHSDLLFSAP